MSDSNEQADSVHRGEHPESFGHPGVPDAPPSQPWWRGPLGGAALALVAAIGVVVGINAAAGSPGSGDTDDASVESEDLAGEPGTETAAPLLNDCELMAESIFNDMDAGMSTVDIYVSYGGAQDPDTQHFVNIYYRWRESAMQVGREEALDMVYDEVTAWCSGGDPDPPTDPYGN